MKINRGNRDVQENVMNVNQDNTKEKEKENVVVQQTPEAPTLEEIESEVKTAPVQIKGTQVTKKVDPVIKIQKAKELIEAKKERDEKLKKIEEEKNEIIKKSVESAPFFSIGQMKGGLSSNNRKTKAKIAELRKRYREDEDYRKKIQSAEKVLSDLRREEIIRTSVDTTLSVQLRHKDKVNISSFYSALPEDIILKKDTDNGVVEIKVAPLITYNEVMDMIEWIINIAASGRQFISIPVLRIIEDMGMIKFYTNLNVKDNELLDSFDFLKRFGIIDEVKEQINQEQLEWTFSSIEATMDNIVEYQNSARGILDIINEEAKSDTMNLDKLLKTVSDNKEAFDNFNKLLQRYEKLNEGAQEIASQMEQLKK